MTDTQNLVMSFLLLMTRELKWFIKLQEEVDRVVGSERLPTLDDMSDLPIVRAFAKETLRYYPVTAGGVPHLLIKDDVYEGFFLKKGTLISLRLLVDRASGLNAVSRPGDV